MQDAEKKQKDKKQKYECPCGYIYDPVEGDSDNNIDEDTPFSDLPDDWVCPTCQAEQEDFYKIDDD